MVCFNENIVKVCESYLKKGSLIYVEGALQTRKYEQGGVEKYASEIVLQKFNGVLTMLGGKSEGQSDADEGFSGPAGRATMPTGDIGDDIPW